MAPTASMAPGQRIRYERENMGLSQEELAEKIGCSPQQVKRWEKGEAFPQPAWRRKLSAQFGKSIEELGLTPRNKKRNFLSKGISEEAIGTDSEQDTSNYYYGGTASTNAQQALSYSLPQRFSRRIILAGLGMVAIAGGSTAWWFISHTSGASPVSQAQKFITENAYKTYYIRSGSISYPVYNVAWSPNGEFIAGATQDTSIKVWDISYGKQMQTYEPVGGPIDGVAWSPDGTLIAAASDDTTVQIWNAVDGHKTLSYKGHTQPVAAVAWSPDGKHIASAGADKKVQVWDATTGNTIYTYTGHNELVWAVAWSHDSKRIASGGIDSTVQVWDATTGAHPFICRGHSQDVYDVEWSPDDKLVASAGVDKTVRVWDAGTGKTIYTYRGHSAPVHAASWSPDGKRLASGGGDPHARSQGNIFAVQTWDAMTGKHVHIYSGHTMTIYGVVWSPKGTFIASGSADSSIRIWPAI